MQLLNDCQGWLTLLRKSWRRFMFGEHRRTRASAGSLREARSTRARSEGRGPRVLTESQAMCMPSRCWRSLSASAWPLRAPNTSLWSPLPGARGSYSSTSSRNSFSLRSAHTCPSNPCWEVRSYSFNLSQNCSNSYNWLHRNYIFTISVSELFCT